MRNQSKKVQAFLDAVVELEKSHGLIILHEDMHGGFEVADLAGRRR